MARVRVAGVQVVSGGGSEEVDVVEGIDAVGFGAEGGHAGAGEGVEDGGGDFAEFFEIAPGLGEGVFGVGLAVAQEAGGVVEGVDGGFEADEEGLGGLFSEADAEVAAGVELLVVGAGGEGFAALGEEVGVGDAADGGLGGEGEVPGFEGGGGVGVGFAGEAGEFVFEGEGAGGEEGFLVGDEAFGGVVGGDDALEFAADGLEDGHGGGGEGDAGVGVGEDFAHEGEAAFGGDEKLVLGVFGGLGHGGRWFEIMDYVA